MNQATPQKTAPCRLCRALLGGGSIKLELKPLADDEEFGRRLVEFLRSHPSTPTTRGSSSLPASSREFT